MRVEKVFVRVSVCEDACVRVSVCEDTCVCVCVRVCVCDACESECTSVCFYLSKNSSVVPWSPGYEMFKQ